MSAVTVARNVRVAIWTVLAVIVVGGVIWFALFTASKPAAPLPQASADPAVVREDSHRLTAPAAEKAQLVEFLDFECEACHAAEPLVSQLKKDYGDRITFVHRYFPCPDT
ncbi:dsba oxidoreductase [Arthrobacter sp. Hiyo4]|nr:dsba oxidoreductase [Arthrobacter sp. Hiyo4]